jgi:hypothetical protein
MSGAELCESHVGIGEPENPIKHSAQHDDRGDQCRHAREASGQDEVLRRRQTRQSDCLHNLALSVSLPPTTAGRRGVTPQLRR